MAAKGLSLDVVAWTAMLGACAERWDVALRLGNPPGRAGLPAGFVAGGEER